jgi:hypothetical protein
MFLGQPYSSFKFFIDFLAKHGKKAGLGRKKLHDDIS